MTTQPPIQTLIEKLEALKSPVTHMNDSVRNSAIDEAIKIVERHWHAYVPVQSKIPVVELIRLMNRLAGTLQSLRTSAVFEGDLNPNSALIQLVDALLEKYRITPIVPVSIQDCVDAMLNEPSDEYPELAKVVLDAAGVEYVN